MVKEVEDYVATIQKKFPYLSKQEINKIVTFGLKRYAYVNRMHADVHMSYRGEEDNMSVICGSLSASKLITYFIFATKNRMKERCLFRLKKLEWDGYYYIGLKEDAHQEVLKSLKNNTLTFKNVYLTKLKREIYHIPSVKHIWRVPYMEDCGWKFFVETLRTDKADYIGKNHYEYYHQCFLKRDEAGSSSSSDGQSDVH